MTSQRTNAVLHEILANVFLIFELKCVKMEELRFKKNVFGVEEFRYDVIVFSTTHSS
jgi:hypothetical protein